MLTAVVLTKDEQANIQTCLASLPFCDKIIVIDDHSTDGTVEIAKSLGAQIITHTFTGDFAAQRNFALDHVTTPWTLFLDADEVVTPDLASEIQDILASPSRRAYTLRRQDIMWGKPLLHGDSGHAEFIRLGPTSSQTWSGGVHATWNVTGPVGKLSSPLLHYPHPTIVDFLDHINRWSTYRTQELIDFKITPNFAQVLFFPLGKFIYTYLYQLGFLDGMPGLLSALTMSLYTFLVRGKLFLHAQGLDIHG